MSRDSSNLPFISLAPLEWNFWRGNDHRYFHFCGWVTGGISKSTALPPRSKLDGLESCCSASWILKISAAAHKLRGLGIEIRRLVQPIRRERSFVCRRCYATFCGIQIKESFRKVFAAADCLFARKSKLRKKTLYSEMALVKVKWNFGVSE